MRGRLPVALAALILVLSSASIAAQAGQYSSSRTDGYPAANPREELVETALAALAAGEWELALELARAGLEVAQEDSDLRHIAARALVGLRRPRALAIHEMRAALAADRFRLTERDAACVFGAALLIDTRRFQEALRLLEEIQARRGWDADFLYERARAWYGLGNPGAARNDLAEAQRRHAQDPRFARLFFEQESGMPSSESRALGARFLRSLPELAARDPDLLYRALPFMPDQVQRRELLKSERLAGRAGRKGAAPALNEGLIDSAAAVREFFAERDAVSFSDLAVLLAALEAKSDGKSGLAAFEQALGGYTGRMHFDRDTDGIPDAAMEYRDGRAARLERDADQDGIPELLLDYELGVARSARCFLPDIVYKAEYGEYPFLRRVVQEPGQDLGLLGEAPKREAVFKQRLVYHLAPLQVTLPVAGLLPYPSPMSLFRIPAFEDLVPLSERGLLASTVSLERVHSDSEYELFLVDHGLALSSELYRDDRLCAKREYVQGILARELVDLDLDGRFETRRIYAGSPAGLPRVRALEMDLDGDGYAEYRERLEPSLVKEWDYDADGRVDARETRRSDGSLLRELSSRLDGELDERLTFSAEGGLVSAERRGARLSLLADRNPRLRWIGKKPFDLGGNLPPFEGVYRHMGLRYRLIYAGTEAFAELLP